jgi:DnaA regulatory inactivator Hda
MGDQLIFTLPHRVAHGREDFLVGSCNDLAIDWLDRWPDWPAPLLLLLGPTGSGKTHLLHVHIAKTQAISLGYEDLQDTSAIELARMGPLVLDDADQDINEDGLFHLLNAVREEGQTLLLTAASAPKNWPLTLADLRSRLIAAPIVEIGPVSDDVLTGLLQKLFRDRQISVEEGVVNYILTRMERSFVAAAEIVKQLDQLALKEKRRITIPLARQIMDGRENLAG